MSTIINYLTAIYFGSGAKNEIPALLDQLGISKPLLVTDAGLISAGIPARLAFTPNATFADIRSNPDEASVHAGVKAYADAGCDGIVAVGGGSPLDCAKAIGLLATQPPPLHQYAMIHGGLKKISHNQPPLVAVATTSGTGSEVGRASLITMNDGEKLGLISPHMIPTAAVCDPDLTLSLPAALTAATGMDAISHCVETYCSPRYNPVADSIALDGLVRAVGSIRKAVSEGTAIRHRTEMMMASLQGGLTFQKGLGMIHSLSHPLGGLPDKRLHHGMLNAVFLPHVLRYNAEACPEKMTSMAAALSIDDPAGLPSFFEALVRELGLPTALSEMGVDETDFAGIASAAMRDHSTPWNPREMSLSDCEIMLRAAL